MFNIKRVLWLMIFGFSALWIFGFLIMLFDILKESIKDSSGLGIYLLAWPITLTFLILVFIFINLAILSSKKIKDIDKNSNTDINKRFPPPVKITPIIKFGLIFFALFTLLALIVSLLN
jgi:uncharacterized membrane protein YhaH (DUF805 family)